MILTPIILIVSFAIIAFFAWHKPKHWQWGVGIPLVLLLGWSLTSCGSTKKPTTRMATPPTQGTNPPPTVAVTLVPAQDPWTFKTITIPKGGIAVRLYNGWEVYALGGPLKMVTPNDEVLHVTPGIENKVGNQPDGTYLITSNPVGVERKARIYNRWKTKTPAELE